MCHAVTCSHCGRPTWAGCGQHIEQALAGVPEADRCHCARDDAPQSAGAQTPAKPGFFSRLRQK